MSGEKKATRSATGSEALPSKAKEKDSQARDPGETERAQTIGARQFQFLFSPKFHGGVRPLSVSAIGNTLANLNGVRVIEKIRSATLESFAGDDEATPGDVVVAEMSWARALELQASASAYVQMERNWELQHLGAFQPNFAGTSVLPPAIPATTQVRIQVLDHAGQPLPRAQVMLFGTAFPAQAETGADGRASLPVYGSGLSAISALYVKPFADHWECYIPNPALDVGVPNTVQLAPLAAFGPSRFPGEPFIGWGQAMLGLDSETIASYSGRGVRIAIIDSGCDVDHPALTHIKHGLDFTTPAGQPPDSVSWRTDSLSHGTHCAGVIAGNGQGGIRGFAPEAEVHILKLFPGGRFADLISSLKYCIENKIDIVNCSLGADQGSEFVKQWIERARQAGIAVVVAAGNSGGSVQFPALLPDVLAVSAIGREGTFPRGTYHEQTAPVRVPGVVGLDGVFSPQFTCFGKEIRVCGPGVAVISSVPGGGYAAWDGTSMAAPHVTGLLALLASHDPDIANLPRTPARVDRLFETLVRSATSLGLESTRAGSGLPSLKRAVAKGVSGSPAISRSMSHDIDALVNAVLLQVGNKLGLQ